MSIFPLQITASAHHAILHVLDQSKLASPIVSVIRTWDVAGKDLGWHFVVYEREKLIIEYIFNLGKFDFYLELHGQQELANKTLDFSKGKFLILD